MAHGGGSFTMAGSMPMSELSASHFLRGKVRKSNRWLPIKDADIIVLKKIFQEIDTDKSKSIEVNEVIHYFSSHTEDKVMTYLANHVHGFFNVIDVDKSGDITFEEFISSVLPRCPLSQVRDWVSRLSPDLDIEGRADPIDVEVREQLKAFGQPDVLGDETKAARRLRLAMVRALDDGEDEEGEEHDLAKGLLQGDRWAVGLVNDVMMPEINKTKPPKTAGVRVSFQWRSREAKRLVECGAAGRPLLTLDGLPLHSHPSLQLMKPAAGYDEESIERQIGLATAAANQKKRGSLAMKQIGTLASAVHAKRALMRGANITSKSFLLKSGSQHDINGSSGSLHAIPESREGPETDGRRSSLACLESSPWGSPREGEGGLERTRSQSVPPGAEGGGGGVTMLPDVKKQGSGGTLAGSKQGCDSKDKGEAVKEGKGNDSKSGAGGGGGERSGAPKKFGHIAKKQHMVTEEEARVIPGFKRRHAKPVRKKRQEMLEELQAMIDSGDADGLRALFEGYVREGVHADTRMLRLLMQGSLQLSRPDMTISFFEQCTTLVNEVGSAMRSVKRTPATVPGHQGHKGVVTTADPDEFCVVALIDAYGRMGNLEFAKSTFKGVPALGLTQDPEMYSAMIRACIINNQMTQARAYIEDMIQEKIIDRLAPDLSTALSDMAGGLLANYSANARKAPGSPVRPKRVTGKSPVVRNAGAEEKQRKKMLEVEANIADEVREKEELLERIESLMLTVGVLDDVDSGLAQSDRGLVAQRLQKMRQRVKELDFHITGARRAAREDKGQMRRHAVVSVKKQMASQFQAMLAASLDSEEEDGLLGDAPTIEELQAVDADRKRAEQSQEADELPKIRIVLPPKRMRDSKSGGIDFYSTRQPFFVYKTITAMPKSYVTGEHVLIAVLQPSDTLHSTKDNPVHVIISGLTGLKTRDADFIAVHGAGGRRCTNLGGRWRKEPGVLRLQIANGESLPEKVPLTFRFTLNVDPTQDRAPVTPIIEVSGPLAISPSPMTGEVLGFQTSRAKERRARAKEAEDAYLSGAASPPDEGRAISPYLGKQTPQGQGGGEGGGGMSPLDGQRASPQSGALSSGSPRSPAAEGSPSFEGMSPPSGKISPLETKRLGQEGGRVGGRRGVGSPQHGGLDHLADFKDWGCNLDTGKVERLPYRFDLGLFNAWRPLKAKVYMCVPIRDFVLERAALEETVLPQLEDLCTSNLVSLTTVDLRSGIDEGNFRQAAHLKIALDEADRCHYFVCMIGHRIGWHHGDPIARDYYDDALRGVHVVSVEEHVQLKRERDEIVLTLQQRRAAERNVGTPPSTRPVTGDSGMTESNTMSSSAIDFPEEFCGRILPQGTDVTFFRAQVHAMLLGHTWVKERLHCSMMELEILHRLRPELHKEGRTFFLLRSDDYLAHIQRPRNWADLPEACTQGREEYYAELYEETEPDSKKLVIDLKKRLASGEMGNMDVLSYTHPAQGASAAGAALGRVLQRDWLAGAVKMNAEVPPRLVAMDDAHKAFALNLVETAVPLARNREAEGRIEEWLAKLDTLGIGVPPFIVHGGPGAGQSAFLASVWRRQLERGRFDSVFLHVAEVDSSATSMLARCVSALSRLTSSKKAMMMGTGELLAQFLALAASLARGQKALIIIDGAADLVDEDGVTPFDLVGRLPSKIPSSVRLLVGVNTGPANLANPTLNQWPVVELQALSRKDQEHLVRSVLGRRSMNFGDAAKRLAQRNGKAHVRLARTLVDSVLVVGHAQDFQEMMTVSEVWQSLISRNDMLNGVWTSRSIVLLLAAARFGMSRRELIGALQHIAGRDMPGLMGNMTRGSSRMGSRGSHKSSAPIFERVASHFLKGTAPLIAVCGVLEPLEMMDAVWERGSLLCLHRNVRASLLEACGVREEEMGEWHAALGEYFMQSGERVRAVRECPYQMMMANDRPQLINFLSDPDWTATFVSERLIEDFYRYWKFTGKSRLSEHYMSVLPQAQCWGCMTKGIKSAAWVHEMIRTGLAGDGDKMMVAIRVQAEMTRRTGRSIWSADQIHVHMTQHSLFSNDETVAQAVQRTLLDVRKVMAAKGAREEDYFSETERMRFVVHILLEGLKRSMARQVKRTGGEIDMGAVLGGKEDPKTAWRKAHGTYGASLHNKIGQETEIIYALFRALVFQDEERYNVERTTSVQDKVVSTTATEITVDSAARIGIKPTSFFPTLVTVGDEVVTVKGVTRGNVLQVSRAGNRAKVHLSGVIVTFSMRLSGDPSGYAIRIRLAARLGCDKENVTAEVHSNMAVRKGGEEKAKGDAEHEYDVLIWTLDDAEATSVVELLRSDVFEEWRQPHIDTKFVLVKISRDIHVESTRPTVYAQVLTPNKTLALDYYYCAYVAYLLKDYPECQESLLRARAMARQVALDPLNDLLVVQCDAFIWLLHVDQKHNEEASAQLQEIVVAQAPNKALGGAQAYSKLDEEVLNLRGMLSSAGRLLSNNPTDFQRLVERIRASLSPQTLSDMDAATLLPTSFMWLVVHLVSARDLLSLDANGYSDPFVTISIDADSRSSSVKLKTLNPDWDEHIRFSGVMPRPQGNVQFDVWDWDGDGSQELIGYAVMKLKDAVESEGGEVVLNLKRLDHEHSKGAQSDGIKLQEKGVLSMKFFFSRELRGALETSVSVVGHALAGHHHVVVKAPTGAGKRASSRVVPVQRTLHDETLPVSASDEQSWIKRMEHVGKLSPVLPEEVMIMVDAARTYYAVCRAEGVLPEDHVIGRMMHAIEAHKDISALRRDGDTVFSVHGGGGGAEERGVGAEAGVGREGRIVAAAKALRVMPWVTVAEFGGNGAGSGVLPGLLDACRTNESIRELMLQSNLLGGGGEGPLVLVEAIRGNTLPHLRALSLSHNRLSDVHVSKIASALSANTTITFLDISHNDARSGSAIALGQMLGSNSTLETLRAGWNRLGQEVTANPAPEKHPLKVIPAPTPKTARGKKHKAHKTAGSKEAPTPMSAAMPEAPTGTAKYLGDESAPAPPHDEQVASFDGAELQSHTSVPQSPEAAPGPASSPLSVARSPNSRRGGTAAKKKRFEGSHRECLLRLDTDGRWCRHILGPDVGAFAAKMRRVCGVFKLEKEGASFCDALQAYAESAGRVFARVCDGRALRDRIQNESYELFALKKQRSVMNNAGKPKSKSKKKGGSEEEEEEEGEEGEEEEEEEKPSPVKESAQESKARKAMLQRQKKELEDSIRAANILVREESAKEREVAAEVKQEVHAFVRLRDAVMAETEAITREFRTHSMGKIALQSLAAEMEGFALFDSLNQAVEGVGSGVITCGRDALFDGALNNSTLTTLELPWNGLGGSRSANTCQALAAVLCAENCQITSLDISCNLLGSKGTGVGIGQVLASAIEGSTKLKHICLDGNSLGDRAARTVLRSASTLPHIRVSLLGCLDKIVHPHQRNPSAPYGLYSLELSDPGARNLVRGMISLMCRGKALFRDGRVKYTKPGAATKVIEVPLTKYMQWENWAVPEIGNVEFELMRPDGTSGGDARNRRPRTNDHVLKRDAADSALRTLRSIESTSARDSALEAIAESGITIDATRGAELMSLCRDLPERMRFMMRAWNHVEGPDGKVNVAVLHGNPEGKAFLEKVGDKQRATLEYFQKLKS